MCQKVSEGSYTIYFEYYRASRDMTFSVYECVSMYVVLPRV